MNIDEMQAGWELDALVAEKVMGWQWIQSRWQDDPVVYRSLCSPDDLAEFPNVPRATITGRSVSTLEPICPGMMDGDDFFLRCFSTRTDRAWEVWTTIVDKTQNRAEWLWRFFPEGEIRINCFVGEYLMCEELESGCGAWSVEGPMPLAVCWAALKAEEMGILKS